LADRRAEEISRAAEAERQRDRLAAERRPLVRAPAASRRQVRVRGDGGARSHAPPLLHAAQRAADARRGGTRAAAPHVQPGARAAVRAARKTNDGWRRAGLDSRVEAGQALSESRPSDRIADRAALAG